MRILVTFTCICLFTFAQGQYPVQTTSSFKVFVKEWVKKIQDSQFFNLSTSIDKIIFIDSSDVSNANKKYEEVKNKCNVTNNDEGGHTISIANNNKTNSSDILPTPLKKNNKEANTEDVNVTSERNKSNVTISNKSNDPSDETEISSRKCTEKNERYPIPDSCDRYFECQAGKLVEKQCPDGLRYNHNIKSNVYPCQYPADVQCNPGSTLQPSKRTEICPNQFGYFKTIDRFNCSSFRICENGIGYDYICPDGLAFNTLTYRCEWPDKVPECDVEALLGYRCPDVADSKNLNVSRGYRSPTDCRIYFSCINRKPRRYECDEYFAFDEIIQNCVPANLVAKCPDDQKNIASRFIRKNSNGEYVIRDFNDEYYMYRSGNINFTPIVKKRPKTI